MVGSIRGGAWVTAGCVSPSHVADAVCDETDTVAAIAAVATTKMQAAAIISTLVLRVNLEGFL